MSIDIVTLDSARRASGLATVLLLLLVMPAMAQPHAVEPLPTPHFSVDRASPLNGLTPGSARGVLVKPGPMIEYPGVNLGLWAANDDLDGMSYNRAPAVGPGQDFLLLFGVDRSSTGGIPPDADLVGLNRPFNVQDQAERQQQAGDLYLALDAFTRQGQKGPRDPGRPPAQNSTLAINQGDTGGVDKDLSPESAPIQGQSTRDDIDNSNAVAYPPGPGGNSRDAALFFTVTDDSPSLGNSLPGISGADIFVISDPATSETPSLYADATTDLGLLSPGGDDINALIVFDDGDGEFNAGVDQILFSLAPESPSLGLFSLSAADILTSTGGGSFGVFKYAIDLGLQDTLPNNVDCLELIPIELPPEDDVEAHAIFLVWPGDVFPPPHGDGSLDQDDCENTTFGICYTGEDVPYTTIHDVDVGPGPAFDPANITIEIGDTVRWTWQTLPGEFHNVVSGSGTPPVHDGHFRSGDPTDVPGTTFEVTFNDDFLVMHTVPGNVYEYYCEVHWGSGMIGSITVVPHPCATFDLNFDGDIDCGDWIDFKPVYAEATGGEVCVLSVPDFVAALLGTPLEPGHDCMADMNDDGFVNGRDIQRYVDAVLGTP